MLHDQAGHQGMERTLHRLAQTAYWAGMAKSVSHFCSHCFTCQTTKAPPHIPVPLHPVITSRPRELVAVDILKVPLSRHGNQYFPVAQDYFSKWPFVMPMPNQKADQRDNKKEFEECAKRWVFGQRITFSIMPTIMY